MATKTSQEVAGMTQGSGGTFTEALAGGGSKIWKPVVSGAGTSNYKTEYVDETPATPNAIPSPVSWTPSNVASAQATLNRPVQTEEEIFNQKRSQSQSVIDEINKRFDLALQGGLADQEKINKEAEMKTRMSAGLAGLSGSPTGSAQITETQGEGAKASAKVRAQVEAQRNAELSQVFQNIQASAERKAEAEALRGDAQAKDIVDKYDAESKATREASAKMFGMQGFTAEEVAKNMPEEYQNLLNLYDGNESALRAEIFFNRPKDEQVGDIKYVGNKAYRTYKTPQGQYKTDTIDLGFDVPKNYSKEVDLGDRIMLIDPTNPTDKPLIFSKGIAPKAPSAGTGTGGSGVSQELQDAITAGTIDPNRINSRTLGIYNDLAKGMINTAASHADIAGKTKAYQDAVNYGALAKRTVTVLDKNMPLVYATADKVNQLGVPGLDNILRGAKSYTGNNPDVIKYVNTVKTLRSEYANMLAKGTATTESMRQDAEDAIPMGLSSDGYRALASQLKLEAQNIIDSANETKNSIYNMPQSDITGVEGGKTGGVQPTQADNDYLKSLGL
jgi:hypothetical protein